MFSSNPLFTFVHSRLEWHIKKEKLILPPIYWRSFPHSSWTLKRKFLFLSVQMLLLSSLLPSQATGTVHTPTPRTHHSFRHSWPLHTLIPLSGVPGPICFITNFYLQSSVEVSSIPWGPSWTIMKTEKMNLIVFSSDQGNYWPHTV